MVVANEDPHPALRRHPLPLRQERAEEQRDPGGDILA
jgi:hypothetical protein